MMKRASVFRILASLAFLLLAGCDDGEPNTTSTDEPVPCTTTDGCPVGTFCVEGFCEDTCLRGTADCACTRSGGCSQSAEGEQLACIEGICGQLDCPEGALGCDCGEGATCDTGLFCNAASGAPRCEPESCQSGGVPEVGTLDCGCKSDRTCDEGLCAAGLCTDLECTPGTLGCVCNTDYSCGSGLTCDLPTGLCAQPGVCTRGNLGCDCKANGSCLSGFTCREGTCQDATCPAGGAGCACRDGACGDTATGEPLLCNAGVCEQSGCPAGDLGCVCQGGEDCNDDAICVDGYCKATDCTPGTTGCDCLAGSCKPGLSCEGSVCIDQTGRIGGPCFDNNTCMRNARCDTSVGDETCVYCDLGTLGCQCQDDDSCNPGLACTEGHCVGDETVHSRTEPDNPKCYTPCSRDLDDATLCDADGLLEGCADGLECTEGSCVPTDGDREMCFEDADCADFQLCIKGFCYSECEQDSDCDAGLACHAKVCRKRCTLSASSCSEGLTCESSDGQTGFCLPRAESAGGSSAAPPPEGFELSNRYVRMSNVTTETRITFENFSDKWHGDDGVGTAERPPRGPSWAMRRDAKATSRLAVLHGWREIDRVVLRNEYQQRREVGICNGELMDWAPGDMPTECNGAPEVFVLQEPDVIDSDNQVVQSPTELPAYGSRVFKAAELNAMTKACNALEADYNFNGREDILEVQPLKVADMTWDASPSQEEFFYAAVSYFTELHTARFSPRPGGIGIYTISERNRCGQVPLTYEVGPDLYWEGCMRLRDASYDEVGDRSGMDFAAFSCDTTSGTCPLQVPDGFATGTSLDGDAVVDHDLCAMSAAGLLPLANEPWLGMSHHSQFQCVQIATGGAGHQVLRSDLRGGGSAPEFDLNACDVAGSTTQSTSSAQPLVPNITCAHQAADVGSVPDDSVGFASARYLNATGSYTRGCINESLGTVPGVTAPSVEIGRGWSRLCPGFTQSGVCFGNVCTTASLTAGNRGDFGKLICSCGQNYSGAACEIGCTDNGLHLGGSDNNSLSSSERALYACFEVDPGASAYCSLHPPESGFTGGVRGAWMCGEFTATMPTDTTQGSVLSGAVGGQTAELHGNIRKVTVTRQPLTHTSGGQTFTLY